MWQAHSGATISTPARPRDVERLDGRDLADVGARVLADEGHVPGGARGVAKCSVRDSTYCSLCLDGPWNTRWRPVT